MRWKISLLRRKKSGSHSFFWINLHRWILQGFFSPSSRFISTFKVARNVGAIRRNGRGSHMFYLAAVQHQRLLSSWRREFHEVRVQLESRPVQRTCWRHILCDLISGGAQEESIRHLQNSSSPLVCNFLLIIALDFRLTIFAFEYFSHSVDFMLSYKYPGK